MSEQLPDDSQNPNTEQQLSFLDKMQAKILAFGVITADKIIKTKENWDNLSRRKKLTYGLGAAAVVGLGLYIAYRYNVNDTGVSDLSTTDIDASGNGEYSSPDATTIPSPEMTDSTDPSSTPSAESKPSSQPTPESSAASSGPDLTSGNESSNAVDTGSETSNSASNLSSSQEKFANSGAKYPWQAAYDAYGDKAGSALKQAVKLAKESGLDVQTFGEGQNWSIKVNGSWNSQEVVKALAEFMPKK